MQPPILVGGLVSTIAVTYWYSWLFNRTGGSVLLVLMAHSIEGSLQAQGWTYMAVWCVAAVGLIVCNLQAWRRPPRAPTAPSNSHRSVTRPRLGHARALIILLGAVYLVASPTFVMRALQRTQLPIWPASTPISSRRCGRCASPAWRSASCTTTRWCTFGASVRPARMVEPSPRRRRSSSPRRPSRSPRWRSCSWWSRERSISMRRSGATSPTSGWPTRRPRHGSPSGTCCTTPAACRRTARSGRCSATTSATKRSATGCAPWRTCSSPMASARCSSTPTPTTTCWDLSCRPSAASPTSPTSPTRSSRRWT